MTATAVSTKQLSVELQSHCWGDQTYVGQMIWFTRPAFASQSDFDQKTLNKQKIQFYEQCYVRDWLGRHGKLATVPLYKLVYNDTIIKKIFCSLCDWPESVYKNVFFIAPYALTE